MGYEANNKGNDSKGDGSLIRSTRDGRAVWRL